MTFGEHVVTLRKQLKLSQDHLAKKVGTSAPIIGHYKRSEIKPSIEMAKKIADELGVTIDYLMGGSAIIMLDKKTMKRIEDIEALPAEEKDKVYYFIDMAITHHKTKKLSLNKFAMNTPQYITDHKGNKLSVILPVKDYKKMVEELEELEDIRLYDEAKKNDTGERIPMQEAFTKIEAKRKNKS